MEPINPTLLADFGLTDLSPEAQQAALGDIYAIFDERLGQAVAERLSEAQMAEFEKAVNQEDDGEAASKWIEANVPDYPQLADMVYQDLKTSYSATVKQLTENQPEA